MRTTALILTPLVLLTPARPLDDVLQARETKGAVLSREFSELTEWKLISMEREVDGSSVTLSPPKMNGRVERRLALSEECVAADAGAALHLRRRFERVTGNAALDFGLQEPSTHYEFALASPLEGLTVHFERAEPSAEFKARLAPESTADSALLEGLRPRLDWASWVDEVGLQVGDSWKVDLAQLRDVLAPAGELVLLPGANALESDDEGLLDPTEILAASLCTLGDNVDELSGEALCTWKDTREVEGRRLAEIEVDWEGTSRTDASARLERRIRSSGVYNTRDDLHLMLSIASSGKGQLSWDVEHHRVHALALELRSQIGVRFSFSDQAADVVYVFDLEATSQIRGKTGQE